MFSPIGRHDVPFSPVLLLLFVCEAATRRQPERRIPRLQQHHDFILVYRYVLILAVLRLVIRTRNYISFSLQHLGPLPLIINSSTNGERHATTRGVTLRWSREALSRESHAYLPPCRYIFPLLISSSASCSHVYFAGCLLLVVGAGLGKVCPDMGSFLTEAKYFWQYLVQLLLPGKPQFSTKQIPDLTGQVMLVTGVSAITYYLRKSATEGAHGEV